MNWTAGLSQDDHNLYASILDVRATPESKALAEGFLSGLTLLNQSADLVVGKGIANAVGVVEDAVEGAKTGYGSTAFSAISGGWSRYNVGSHTDVSGISLMAGLAWGQDRLTLGAFFEYGNGSYDTYNSFANAASVRGDGTINHVGGGVFGRMDFRHTGPGRFYAEAAGRVGDVRNKYQNGDFRDAVGRCASYVTSSVYYGTYAGLGYLWNINGKASLDLHGNYFWTRQNGKSITLLAGDPVTFGSVNSHRLRVGTRFSYTISKYISPYAGIAFEHEFDGKARAFTNGLLIDAPTLRGNTGNGELGIVVKPNPGSRVPVTIDLGVQGYVGKREGVTGALRVGLAF